jgi:hypothetical protein
MAWTQPADLRRQVQKLWDRGTLLGVMLNGEPLFPRRFTLKGPTSRELADRFPEVRQWISVLQNQRDYRIEWREIRHRIIGANNIPRAAWIDSPEQACKIIGKKQQARQFEILATLTHTREPVIKAWLRKYPLKALALKDDWPLLLDVISWLTTHPHPGIYLRQVDIPGVHSKFIEKHRGTLRELLDIALAPEVIHNDFSGITMFARRYGFKEKPLRVRLRILDPAIRLVPGDNQDITLTQDSFRLLNEDQRIQGKIRRLFITENEINFLAFPSFDNSLVIFGAGYGFENLADVPWVPAMEVYYWGDIDTHGFAILDQFRACVPHAHSLLMDKDTLLAHQSMWTTETQPECRTLTRLTSAEQQLYETLHANRLGQNVRLEQERIGFHWLVNALNPQTRFRRNDF